MDELIDDLVEGILLHFPPADPSKSRPRRAGVQALAPPHIRPGLPPQIRRAPPEPAHARLLPPHTALDALPACGLLLLLLPPAVRRRRPADRRATDARRGRVLYSDGGALVVSCPMTGDARSWPAIDAHHSRVLLFSAPSKEGQVPLEKPLLVWDPVTGQRRQLPVAPASFRPDDRNGVVLCASAAAACDHLDCHRGPFLIVLVGTTGREMLACVYSSEAGAWSEPTFAQNQSCCSVSPTPSALVGNALHFRCWHKTSVLRYDLATRRMSMLHLPAGYSHNIALMPSEGGALGFATMVNSALCLYSWEADRDEDAGWAKTDPLSSRLPSPLVLT
ncbi:hypothetical protein BS78_02G014600 [Paspalum vaginatum]|nr:hypothetical protein BS78_02G014600 [Paspalum vaginatum]